MEDRAPYGTPKPKLVTFIVKVRIEGDTDREIRGVKFDLMNVAGMRSAEFVMVENVPEGDK